VEFILVLFEKWETSADNQAAKAVSNECKATKLAARTILTDIVMNFFRQSLSHFENVLIGVSFVGL